MTVVDKIKEGMYEAARLYGWVNNIYGTIEYVDVQVAKGLDDGKFPFPVYYAIKTKEGNKFKLLRVFLKKDLTESTLPEYLKTVADPNHWRNLNHAKAMDQVMREI